jgi:hypothetical protein
MRHCCRSWKRLLLLPVTFAIYVCSLLPHLCPVQAIYPKDLFEYSTYLESPAALYDHIGQEINFGRTLIVRVIAGPQ